MPSPAVSTSLPLGLELSSAQDILIWASNLTPSSCERIPNLPIVDQFRILETRSRNGIFHPEDLMPGCHSIEEVLASIRLSADKLLSGHPSQIQKIALQEFRTKTNDIDVSTLPDIDYTLDLCDKICFGGLLKGRCTIRFVAPDEMAEVSGSQEAIGHTHSPRGVDFDFSKDPIPMTENSISPGNLFEPQYRRYRRICETLAHEMTHAVLHTYCCLCGSGQDSCYHKSMNGVSGHGPPFQTCLMMVQEICWKLALIPGFSAEFALDREREFANDLARLQPVQSLAADRIDSEDILNWTQPVEKLTGLSRKQVEAFELDLHATMCFWMEYHIQEIPFLRSSHSHPLLHPLSHPEVTTKYSSHKEYFYRQWCRDPFLTEIPWGYKPEIIHQAIKPIMDSKVIFEINLGLFACLAPRILSLQWTLRTSSVEWMAKFDKTHRLEYTTQRTG